MMFTFLEKKRTMSLTSLSLFALTILQLPSSLLSYHIPRSSNRNIPSNQRLNDEFAPFRSPSLQATRDFPSPPMKIRIRMPQHTNLPLPPLNENMVPRKPFVPLPSLLGTLRKNYLQPPQAPLRISPPPPNFRWRQTHQVRLPMPFGPPPNIVRDYIPLPFPPPPYMDFIPRRMTLKFPPVPTPRGERWPLLTRGPMPIFPTPGPRGYIPRPMLFPIPPPWAGPPSLSNDFAESSPRIPFQLNNIILSPPPPQFRMLPRHPTYRPFPWQMNKGAGPVLTENSPFMPFANSPFMPFAPPQTVVDAPPRIPMPFPNIIPRNPPVIPPPYVFVDKIHQLLQGGLDRPLPRLLLRNFL